MMPREFARARGFSEVQQTIVEQLYALKPDFGLFYHVDAILSVHEKGMDGVQVNVRRPGLWVNIQILYNEGRDDYEVRAFRIDMPTASAKKVFDEKGYYVDQLIDVIERVLTRDRNWKRYGRGTVG